MAFYILSYDENGYVFETLGPFDSYTQAADYADRFNYDNTRDYEIEYLPTEN